MLSVKIKNQDGKTKTFHWEKKKAPSINCLLKENKYKDMHGSTIRLKNISYYI